MDSQVSDNDSLDFESISDLNVQSSAWLTVFRTGERIDKITIDVQKLTEKLSTSGVDLP